MSEGKVIACLNFKGGVGKTTIACHVASALQRRGDKNSLLIDLDPQFNATQLLFQERFFESKQKSGKSSERLFFRNVAQVPAAVFSREGAANPKDLVSQYSRDASTWPPLEVVVGSFDLMKVALSNTRVDRQSAASLMFREFIRHCKKSYDYIVLDLNPGGSILTYYALDAADQLLCPITGDKYSYLGLQLIVDFLDDFLPGKADESLFSLLENNVTADQIATRQREGTAGQLRYQISRKPMMKNSIFSDYVPNSKFLSATIDTKGLFFDRTPSAEDAAEHGELVNCFERIADSLVKNIERRG